MSIRSRLIPVLALVMMAGCSDPFEPADDAGVDAAADAGEDAGTDAGEDAGADAGHDAGVDAGHDAGVDAGHDAGVDAGRDAGVDAGRDAGVVPDGTSQDADAGHDAGVAPDGTAQDADAEDGGDPPADGDDSPGPYWPWCPQASDYVGGDWAVTLRATEEALYCATFDEMRTLEEEYQAKALMRIIPGDYPLPETNGTYPFVLPVCFEFRDPDSQPEIFGQGEVLANHSTSGGEITYRFTITLPLKTASGDDWIWEANLYAWSPSSDIFVVDGSWLDPGGAEFYFTSRLCLDDCNQWLDQRWFDSCRFEDAFQQRHTLVFGSGQIQWYIRMGWSMASTEPAIFNRAVGQLDGVVFDQEEYFLLIYNPSHHHFTRNFAVLFDTPISGACGLKATSLEPWPPSGARRLTTINCDLSDIQELGITNETFETLK